MKDKSCLQIPGALSDANNPGKHIRVTLQKLSLLAIACAFAWLFVLVPAGAQVTVPVVEAHFVPAVVDLRTPDGLITMALTATSGDLSGCQLSNVHIGTASSISLLAANKGRTYNAAFRKSDLSALPGFDGVDGIVTGTLQCHGATSAMITHATARVLKKIRVQAKVKPILTVGQDSFKDLNGNGTLDVYEDWRNPVEKRVEDLLSRMTLAEKAGLMQITSYKEDSNRDYIQNRQIRYLILRGTPKAGVLAAQLNDWQATAEGTRLGIPLVITSNPINNLGGGDAVFEPGGGAGRFSIWPGTLGLAAANNLPLIRDFAEIARAEWRAAGIRKMYGYQVDVASEPRWTRNRTTFGEGPQLNASIISVIVKGFQGQQLGPDSVAMTVKHFPGDGAVSKGLDPHNAEGQYSVYPTAGSLLKYQIVPFKAAIDAGTSAIMPYYNRPSNPLSAAQFQKDWWVSPTQQFEEVGGAYNQTLLTKLLRGTLGFKGYVNTDSGILSNTDWGADALTLPQRFAKSVKAGANIFADNNDPAGLLDAVKQGLLTEEDLNPSVRFLLAEMFKLGLFENPYNDPAQADAIANSPSSQMVADEAHRQSLVLMRNDRHMLPLKDGVKLYVEVLTPDPVAGNRGGGRNPGAANPEAATTGTGNRVAGAAAATQTASLKALLANDPSVHLVDTIGEANAALLWLEPSQFELADKSSVDIALGKNTGIDVAKVQKIEAAVPTVLAINFATAWIINDVEPGAAAVVGTFDVKAQALLDLIHGRFLPSGKLPMSIPANQAAVDANASDVPGYLESFDYSYKNFVNDRYIFGFGMTKF